MHKFGVWAPKANMVSLVWCEQTLLMDGPNNRGWWIRIIPDAECGGRYAFLLDDDGTRFPDPRSLRHNDGVHGLSELYDHGLFEWHHQLWRGAPSLRAEVVSPQFN